MNSYVIVFGLILLVSVAVPAGLLALRRFRFSRSKRRGKMINGTIFSLFASLYAFFLGFCVVTLWTTFGNAKNVVTTEATSLLVANYLSRSFNASGGFREALASYAQSVIQDEWPAMDKNDIMNPETQHRFNQIWDAFRVLKPTEKEDNPLYTNLSVSLVEVARQRNIRSLMLSGNIYPPVWVIIIFGFFGICVGLYYTNPEQDPGQLLVEFVVVFTVLSCIYFIYDMDTPFSGILNVSPQAFVNALIRMQEMSPMTLGPASF